MATPTGESIQTRLIPHEEILVRCRNLLNIIHNHLDIAGILDSVSVIPIRAKMEELKSLEEELRSALKIASPPLTKKEKKQLSEVLRKMSRFREVWRQRDINPILRRDKALLQLATLIRRAGERDNLKVLFDPDNGDVGTGYSAWGGGAEGNRVGGG
jgi:hypothetical protein